MDGKTNWIDYSFTSRSLSAKQKLIINSRFKTQRRGVRQNYSVDICMEGKYRCQYYVSRNGGDGWQWIGQDGEWTTDFEEIRFFETYAEVKSFCSKLGPMTTEV